MKRKETKRRKPGKKHTPMCRARRRAIVIEAIIIILILTLFAAAITNIVLDEMRARQPRGTEIGINPAVFNNIVT